MKTLRRSVVGALLLSLAGWIGLRVFLADQSGVGAQTPPPQVGRVQDAEFLPGLPPRRPMFVLAIGSDARPGVCEPVERCLADSIHLIGINSQESRASVLGIPRDSYVPIPGVGTDKVNTALFHGGPELVVETIEQLVGVEIDAYLLTSFEGFRRMVKTIGGIRVEVPYAIAASGQLPAFAPGPQELDGAEALAFARNRKGVPNGDFSRSENQGLLLIAALRQIRQDVRKDLRQLFRWIVAGMQNIQTDLSLTDAFELTAAALSINPDQVVNRVTPGGLGFAGEASIVILGDEAEAVFADMADDGLLETAAG
jgi:polyisoprenyl-teichoic acid--peptidoglycan teichoic acid transferase